MKLKSVKNSKREVRKPNSKIKRTAQRNESVGIRFKKKDLRKAIEYLEEPVEEEKFKPIEFDGVVDPNFFKPSDTVANPPKQSTNFSSLIKPLDPSDEHALIELTGTADSDVKIKSLSEMIEEALAKKRELMGRHLATYKRADGPPTADDKIVALYRQMAPILAKFRSGKLPKAFKVLPTLKDWEYLLALTRPDNWSAAIVFQATRIFASNMNDRLVQKFYLDILLPRIRDDILEYKRLNYHLFMSVRKAMFKPGAFFKGLILPLVESNTCTLREAVILGSIIEKSSIPKLHVAVALYILCQGENSGAAVPSEAKVLIEQFSGARSLFIRVLLQKQFSLPFKVIGAVFDHFMRFAFLNVSEGKCAFKMPVIFHQSLLCFVHNYIRDLDKAQIKMIDDLAKGNCNLVPHSAISAEIRRIVSDHDDK